VNSNEEIHFSVFSSKATETSRGATKKHLRASVSKRHVKIFLTCEKKKKTTRDEFDHDTSKKVKQRVLYTEVQKRIIQTDIRFRVVMV
jgi:hypothetical protein